MSCQEERQNYLRGKASTRDKTQLVACVPSMEEAYCHRTEGARREAGRQGEKDMKFKVIFLLISLSYKETLSKTLTPKFSKAASKIILKIFALKLGPVRYIPGKDIFIEAYNMCLS